MSESLELTLTPGVPARVTIELTNFPTVVRISREVA